MIPSSVFFSVPAPLNAPPLHGLKWEASAPSSHPPLVCVHGLTRNAWDYAPLADAFAGTRRVLALDMPGRGLSAPYADARNYIYPNYVAACIAVLEKINKGPVDWLGTSMGGLIGMMIAAARPDLIRKLVLNDIGPYLPLAGLQRIAQYVGSDRTFTSVAEAERYCRATYADFGISRDDDWRRFALSTLREKEGGGYYLHYDVRIAEIFALVKNDIDVWPVYDKITAPTLLLRGARSDLLRVQEAHAMMQRGPKAKLVTFEGCGHAPALVSAEQINAVVDFLS